MDSTKSVRCCRRGSELKNRTRGNEDGAGGSHMTIPRFNYKRKNNYPRRLLLLLGSGFGRGVSCSGDRRVGAPI